MLFEDTLQELQALRRRAVKTLGIDRPISITRVVGARLELTTTDGQHYTFEIEAPDSIGADPQAKPSLAVRPGSDDVANAPANVGADPGVSPEPGEGINFQDLSTWTVKELRKLAKKNEIPGYGRMKKAQLVRAIMEARDA